MRDCLDIARWLPAMALFGALSLTACGSGHAAAIPTVKVVVASSVPEATQRAQPSSSRVATAPTNPPAPVATCGPADLPVLVDKSHPLPADYVPPDLVTVAAPNASPGAPIAVQLRRLAADALQLMLAAAHAQQVNLLAQSGYRSFAYQGQVYAAEVKAFGQAQADRESARPGYSEHQLGLAMDFTTAAMGYDLTDAFAATTAGRWLAANGAQFGWVLSYPQNKEAITGYEYEPWHYRFVGVAAAQAFVSSGQTLNQWLAAYQAPCGGS